MDRLAQLNEKLKARSKYSGRVENILPPEEKKTVKRKRRENLQQIKEVNKRLKATQSPRLKYLPPSERKEELLGAYSLRAYTWKRRFPTPEIFVVDRIVPSRKDLYTFPTRERALARIYANAASLAEKTGRIEFIKFNQEISGRISAKNLQVLKIISIRKISPGLYTLESEECVDCTIVKTCSSCQRFSKVGKPVEEHLKTLKDEIDLYFVNIKRPCLV
jgi:hypothetical protein